MPNVYTSDDPKKIERQVASIQRCLGLVEARILLLEQELEELNTNGDSFLREYLELYIFPILEADEETKAAVYESRGKILEDDKYWCADDIKRLKQLRSYLLDMLAGNDDGLLFMLQIQINLKGCENGRNITESVSTGLIQTAEQAYKAALRKPGNNKRSPEVVAAEKHKDTVVKKAKFDLKYFDKTTQLYLYEELLQILKTKVFNDIERDLPRFFAFSIGIGTNINVAFKDSFTQLEARNKKLLKDTQAQLTTSHQAAIARFPEHQDEIALDVRSLILASGICKSPDLSSQKGITNYYRDHYTCASNLKAHAASDSEALAESLELLQEQADIEKAEAERVAAEAAQAAEQERALAEAAKLEAIQAEKARKEQARLERIRKQQQRAIENEEKKKAKAKRHQDAVIQSKTYTPTESHKEKILVISEAAVLANAAELRDLFTGTKYRFSKLSALAKALGGELVEDTRSKHSYLCFNELYEIEAWQEAAPKVAAGASVKGSVSDPHGQGRDSFVYRHNLKLVRSAVRRVMPANYEDLLGLTATSTARVALKS